MSVPYTFVLYPMDGLSPVLIVQILLSCMGVCYCSASHEWMCTLQAGFNYISLCLHLASLWDLPHGCCWTAQLSTSLEYNTEIKMVDNKVKLRSHPVHHSATRLPLLAAVYPCPHTVAGNLLYSSWHCTTPTLLFSLAHVNHIKLLTILTSAWHGALLLTCKLLFTDSPGLCGQASWLPW